MAPKAPHGSKKVFLVMKKFNKLFKEELYFFVMKVDKAMRKEVEYEGYKMQITNYPKKAQLT